MKWRWAGQARARCETGIVAMPYWRNRTGVAAPVHAQPSLVASHACGAFG